jgi:hypothetical protein
MTYIPAITVEPGDTLVNKYSRRDRGWAAPKWRVEQILPNGILRVSNPRRGWREITKLENYLKFEPKALTLAAGAGGMEER